MSKYTDDQVHTALDVLEHTSKEPIGPDAAARKAALEAITDYLQPETEPASTVTALQSALQLQDGGEHFVLASIAELLEIQAESAAMAGDHHTADDLRAAIVAIRHFGLGDPLLFMEDAFGDELQHGIDWCETMVAQLSSEKPRIPSINAPAIAPQFQIPLWHDRKLALTHLLERCAGKTYTNDGAAA